MEFPLCNCLCLTGHTSNGAPERAFGTEGYLGSCKCQTMTLPKLKLKFSKPSNPCLTWKKGRKTEMMMMMMMIAIGTRQRGFGGGLVACGVQLVCNSCH